MRPQFTDKEISQRVFARAAWVMHQSWKENWRHSRLLDEPLIPNHIIMAGRSRAASEHREHVVPLALIRDQCEKMFSQGKDVSAVTKLLERHLKIVMLFKAERLRLDFDLGLKVSMPEGWPFEDENADPFARLKAAGIEWEPIELDGTECL